MQGRTVVFPEDQYQEMKRLVLAELKQTQSFLRISRNDGLKKEYLHKIDYLQKCLMTLEKS